MNWKDKVISDVGKGMNVNNLNFSGTGVIKFEFDQCGDLYIESREEGVLIYLTREIPHHDFLKPLIKTLKNCHYSKPMKFPLQAALDGEKNLLLCSFLDNESFSRPNIEGVIAMIRDHFNEVVDL